MCDVCVEADALRKRGAHRAANVVMDKHPRCKKCTCLSGGEHMTVLPPGGDICLQCQGLMPKDRPFGCYTCGRRFDHPDKLDLHLRTFHGYTEYVTLPTISMRYDSFPTMEGQ